MADFEVLKTVAAVAKALGGIAAVQTLTETKSSQAVSNWLSRERFASHTYLVMITALKELGKTAGPELWGITAPPTREPEAAESASV